MKINNLIMVKLLSFIMCNNAYMKIAIILFMLFDVMKNRQVYIKKDIKDVVIGITIIGLNNILNVNFILVNFFVLGIISSFYKKGLVKFLEIYFFWVSLWGVAVFCLGM